MNGGQTIRFGQVLRRVDVEERIHGIGCPLLDRARVTPGEPVDPRLHEFLKYVLSRQGQEDVMKEGDFLPLTPSLLQEQLHKIE